jgi:glycosyltransferase involved in cell wall biosynthesis
MAKNPKAAISKKPAILVIAPCAFPLDRGTPIRIRRLSQLMSLECEVHVATFHQKQGRDGDYPFQIHRIPNLPFDLTQSSGPSLGKLVSDVFLLFLVLRIVPRYQIRLIDGHLHEGAFIGLIARLLYGVPVIYNSHGTLAAEIVASGLVRENSLPARFLQWLEETIEHSVDLIIAQSTVRYDEFVDKGIPVDQIVIVEDAPLFEDYTVETVDPALVERYCTNTEAILLYTGELMTYQGIDLILDALPQVLEKHPSVKLILFGRPIEPYQARIESENLGGHVFLVDDEPFERLPHYFAIADVALVPRLYGRNVPGKLPIYMMGKQAIIGTDLEGINAVLKHGETGWLIDPTVEAMAGALNTLIEDPALRDKLSQAALAEANRRYAPEMISQGMHTAYTKLLNARS